MNNSKYNQNQKEYKSRLNQPLYSYQPDLNNMIPVPKYSRSANQVMKNNFNYQQPPQKKIYSHQNIPQCCYHGVSINNPLGMQIHYNNYEPYHYDKPNYVYNQSLQYRIKHLI